MRPRHCTSHWPAFFVSFSYLVLPRAILAGLAFASSSHRVKKRVTIGAGNVKHTAPTVNIPTVGRTLTARHSR